MDKRPCDVFFLFSYFLISSDSIIMLAGVIQSKMTITDVHQHVTLTVAGQRSHCFMQTFEINY